MTSEVRALHRGTSSTFEVVPDTLRLLRERRRLRKKDVAESLRKHPSYVTRSESTTRGPVIFGDQERADYASVLRVPPETLSRQFVEAPPEGVHFHTRKLSAEQRRQAVAHAVLTANNVNTMLTMLDVPRPAALPGVDVAGLSPLEAGRKAAQKTREEWGLDDDPIRDLAGLLESRGILLTHMRDLVEGVRGLTMLLSAHDAPVMFLAPYVSDDVRRQTMAHELGHLVMDHTSGPLGAKDTEERATAFGGEFLAPFHMVRDRLTGLSPSNMGELIELQRQWGVHPGAFIQRGFLHGVYTDNQRRHWFQSINLNKRLIDNLPSSYPITMRALAKLTQNVAALGWSEPQLSSKLGFPADELAGALEGWPYPQPVAV